MSNKINMLRAALKETNGRIFSVDFVKKDGTLRTLQGRINVTSPLKGGVNTASHIEKYFTVFDMQKQQYRHVNLETVKRVKCGDFEFSA